MCYNITALKHNFSILDIRNTFWDSKLYSLRFEICEPFHFYTFFYSNFEIRPKIYFVNRIILFDGN